MTADACLALCADSAYYGTQYSEECWCGAEGAEYDANGEGDCTMRCTGDTAEICGGYNAMSVYEINSDDGETDDVDGGEIDDPSYLGCYSDPADNRVFVQDISSAAMTAEACSEACAGSAFYGTQYSTECWCGAEGADYDANGAGVCDMPCGGDADEICGGFYAMSVYENDVDGGETDDVDDGETEDPSYLGCYSDPADNRVFVQDISSAAMTAEVSNRPGCFQRLFGKASASHSLLDARYHDLVHVMTATCYHVFFRSRDALDFTLPLEMLPSCGVSTPRRESKDHGTLVEPTRRHHLTILVSTCPSRCPSPCPNINLVGHTPWNGRLQICSEACAGSAYYGTQYSTEALTTMPTAPVSATCPAAATPTRSAEVSTPCRSTRTTRTTGNPWSSRAPATPEYRPDLPAAKPTAALAEVRVAAPAAPAPLRAAPRASSPLASFAPTPGPPRASSKFLPSLLDVAPRIAYLGHHALPTNRAMVALLLHQSWRNSAQLVSFQDLWRRGRLGLFN
ncbi:unnamed protein product [Ectocarpus sp. 12 AP-2014]